MKYNTVIPLLIRVKDIKEYHFFTNKECPIDLALMRAGYPKLKDKGIGLVNDHQYIPPKHIKGYTQLQKRMFQTYNKLEMAELIKYPMRAKLKLNL